MSQFGQKYWKLKKNPSVLGASLARPGVTITNQNLFKGFSTLGLDTSGHFSTLDTLLHLELVS